MCQVVGAFRLLGFIVISHNFVTVFPQDRYISKVQFVYRVKAGMEIEVVTISLHTGHGFVTSRQ